LQQIYFENLSRAIVKALRYDRQAEQGRVAGTSNRRLCLWKKLPNAALRNDRGLQSLLLQEIEVMCNWIMAILEYGRRL
jgi:hypothetical protein